MNKANSKKNKTAKKKNIKRSNIIQLVGGIIIIISLNIIGNFLYTRIDLTLEKRYTLSPSTKNLLNKIDDIVYFRVYLDGDFPSDFKQLRNETREMLNQFRAFNSNIEYEFINPHNISEPQKQMSFYQRLVDEGVQPTQINQQTKDGFNQLLIFPVAEVIYREKTTFVPLLSSQRYVAQENILNSSIQNIEYSLVDGIRRVFPLKKNRLGFITGHGELPKENVLSIQLALSDYYAIEDVEINEQINSLTERKYQINDSSKIDIANKYDAIVIAKPSKPFSDKDLFILDQFVMYGGKVLWLIDPLDVTMDSLERKAETVAIRNDLRIENILFKYGVRINPNLILDMRNTPIPMATGWIGDKPQISFIPWYYFPEIIPHIDHPIVKNLNSIKTEFISSIDTIDNDIKKTVLLTSSEYSRVINSPAIVSIKIAQEDPDERLFNKRFLPVAVLLEGNFNSAFKNRLDPVFTNTPEMGFLEESPFTKMIVISDGDIIRNNYNYLNDFPYPVGYDRYTELTYGNKEFIINCLNYLCDDDEYLSTRSRDIKLRKLNPLKIKKEQTKFQIINTILPIVLISVLIGLIFILRKKYFTK